MGDLVQTLPALTDALVGATGRNQLHLASDFACVKCHEVECTYGGALNLEPACLAGIEPARVWTELRRFMNGQQARDCVRIAR